MRRFTRPRLPEALLAALATKQSDANAKRLAGGLNVQVTWKLARETKPLQSILGVLKAMTGIRERCMYCNDSHGTDIEHFWPKSPYPERMFCWANLLLCCADCGRIKGTDFPLQAGVPLLIDPTVDDPWVFLDFDPDTGNIVPRFRPEREAWEEKGEQTVKVLELDRRESLAAGYQMTFRRLTDRVAGFLGDPGSDVASLIAALRADDLDHGLLGWCFRGTGQNIPPFSELRTRHSLAWDICKLAFQDY